MVRYHTLYTLCVQDSSQVYHYTRRKLEVISPTISTAYIYNLDKAILSDNSLNIYFCLLLYSSYSTDTMWPIKYAEINTENKICQQNMYCIFLNENPIITVKRNVHHLVIKLVSFCRKMIARYPHFTYSFLVYIVFILYNIRQTASHICFFSYRE